MRLVLDKLYRRMGVNVARIFIEPTYSAPRPETILKFVA